MSFLQVAKKERNRDGERQSKKSRGWRIWERQRFGKRWKGPPTYIFFSLSFLSLNFFLFYKAVVFWNANVNGPSFKGALKIPYRPIGIWLRIYYSPTSILSEGCLYLATINQRPSGCLHSCMWGSVWPYSAEEMDGSLLCGTVSILHFESLEEDVLLVGVNESFIYIYRAIISKCLFLRCFLFSM